MGIEKRFLLRPWIQDIMDIYGSYIWGHLESQIRLQIRTILWSGASSEICEQAEEILVADVVKEFGI
jgi:hypothetical protein